MDADRYLDRVRSAVQGELSRAAVGEFALSLVRQIANDAHDAGDVESVDHLVAELAARLGSESMEAAQGGHADWSDAYDRIRDILTSWRI